MRRFELLLAVFVTLFFAPSALGWTQNFYSQVVKDSIMLSPPEIQLYFTAGKEAVEGSIGRLSEGRYRFADSQDAFLSAVKLLKGKKKDPQAIVAKLLDLVWYVSDAVRPTLDDSKLEFLERRTECFCVLFDGYDRFSEMGEVLGRAKGWLSASTGAVEEFYMFGEVDLEEEAARSFEVMYNAAVNLVVDAWYSAFVAANVPVNPSLSSGAKVFPKGPKPPLQPVELKYRMGGFKKAVYGIEEEQPRSQELSIEERLSSKQAKREKNKGEVGEGPEEASIGETVSLLDLMIPGKANLPEEKQARTEETQSPKAEEAASSQPSKPAGPVSPPDQKKPPEALKEPEAPKESKAPEKPSEASKPKVFEPTVSASISGEEAAGLAKKAERVQSEVGTVGAGGQADLDLEGIFSILEKSGARTSNGREFKPKNSVETPETQEIGINLDTLPSEHKVELSEKAEIRVESPVFVPLGSGSTQGQIEFEEISRAISNNIGGIKFCYELGLKRNPSLAGKIEVEFTIGEDGQVTSARVIASTLRDERVESCIIRKLSSLNFPAPKGGSVTVKYPFVFEQSYQF